MTKAEKEDAVVVGATELAHTKNQFLNYFGLFYWQVYDPCYEE